MRPLAPDDQNRAASLAQQGFGVRPEQEPIQPGVILSPDDEEIRTNLLNQLHDFARGVPISKCVTTWFRHCFRVARPWASR